MYLVNRNFINEVHVFWISFRVCIFDDYVCNFVGFILVWGAYLMTFISMQRRSTIFKTRSICLVLRRFIIWLCRSNWTISRTVIANWPKKDFWFLVISIILFYPWFCFFSSVLRMIFWWISELSLSSLEVSSNFIVLRNFMLQEIHSCKILALVLKIVIFSCLFWKLIVIAIIKMISISGTWVCITLKRNQIILIVHHNILWWSLWNEYIFLPYWHWWTFMISFLLRHHHLLYMPIIFLTCAHHLKLVWVSNIHEIFILKMLLQFCIWNLAYITFLQNLRNTSFSRIFMGHQ